MAVSRFFVAARFPQPFYTISHTIAPHSTLDKFEKGKISLKLRNNVALLCWIFLHKQNQIKKEAKETFFFIYNWIFRQLSTPLQAIFHTYVTKYFFHCVFTYPLFSFTELYNIVSFAIIGSDMCPLCACVRRILRSTWHPHKRIT